jgi:hypothetical protein
MSWPRLTKSQRDLVEFLGIGQPLYVDDWRWHTRHALVRAGLATVAESATGAYMALTQRGKEYATAAFRKPRRG